MPKPRIILASGIAACALLLTGAAAFPTQPAGTFSLDLTPLHRVSTQPTFAAGTYAAEDPHAGHHRTHITAHHHAL